MTVTEFIRHCRALFFSLDLEFLQGILVESRLILNFSRFLIIMSGAKHELISVRPKVLTFRFELERQIDCFLEVANNRLHTVAFKVKTNSPEKYIVRPNKGVILPWQVCLVTVTLHPQKEYPPNMQCKDKFLIQSTIVDPHEELEDLPQDIFTNDCGWLIEECKVKVTYEYPEASFDNSQDDQFTSGERNYEDNTEEPEEEEEVLKRRKNRKRGPLFSLLFSFLVVVVGFAVGFILKLLFSSSTED